MSSPGHPYCWSMGHDEEYEPHVLVYSAGEPVQPVHLLYEEFTETITSDPWTKPGAPEPLWLVLSFPRTALNLRVHEGGQTEQPGPGVKGMVSAIVSEPRTWSAPLTVTDQVPVRVSRQRLLTQLFTPDIRTVPENTPGGIAREVVRGAAPSARGAHNPIPSKTAAHPTIAPVVFRGRLTTPPFLVSFLRAGRGPQGCRESGSGSPSAPTSSAHPRASRAKVR